MANWFKDEIEHFGDVVEKSIDNASTHIQDHIDSLGHELTKQRNLTKQDVEGLIDYAALQFGKMLDERIEKAKVETEVMVSKKIEEVRQQLADASNEQKRAALRNASIAVASAIIVGIVSLLYKKIFQGEFDLLIVFKAGLLALVCGHGIWLITKYLTHFFLYSRAKRNMITVGAQYLGVFKVRGVLGHIILFLLLLVFWMSLGFWPQIKAIFAFS